MERCKIDFAKFGCDRVKLILPQNLLYLKLIFVAFDSKIDFAKFGCDRVKLILPQNLLYLPQNLTHF